jgi:uncharacterized protein (DUF2147 family)
MRAPLFAFVLAVLAAPNAAHASPVDQAYGRWLTQSGKAKIEVAPCGASACGTVVWLADQKEGAAPLLDTRNKDATKRGEKLLGSRMAWGFKPDRTGWVGGHLYNAEDGGAYRGDLLPQPDGTMKVKGCFGPVCRTQTWTRVTP